MSLGMRRRTHFVREFLMCLHISCVRRRITIDLHLKYQQQIFAFNVLVNSCVPEVCKIKVDNTRHSMTHLQAADREVK